MKKTLLENKGQTLIILLLYMEIAIIITTAAVTAVALNAQGTDKVYQGTTTQDAAESGLETAMIKLLRDPAYTGTETLTVNGGTATINITGVNPKVVTSTAVINNFTKKAQATVDITNNVVTVTSWKSN